MKITGYELVKFEGKAERPIGDANGPQGSDYVGMSILILDTDEGLQGFAPLGNDYIKNIFPVIENQDPRSIKGLWKRHGKGKNKSVKLLIAFEDTAQYQKKFHYYDYTNNIVAVHFKRKMQISLAQAIKTAK